MSAEDPEVSLKQILHLNSKLSCLVAFFTILPSRIILVFQHNTFAVKWHFNKSIKRAKRGQSEVYPSLPLLCPYFTLSLPSLCPHFAPFHPKTNTDRIQWVSFYGNIAISCGLQSIGEIQIRYPSVEHTTGKIRFGDWEKGTDCIKCENYFFNYL